MNGVVACTGSLQSIDPYREDRCEPCAPSPSSSLAQPAEALQCTGITLHQLAQTPPWSASLAQPADVDIDSPDLEPPGQRYDDEDPSVVIDVDFSKNVKKKSSRNENPCDVVALGDSDDREIGSVYDELAIRKLEAIKTSGAALKAGEKIEHLAAQGLINGAQRQALHRLKSAIIDRAGDVCNFIASYIEDIAKRMKSDPGRLSHDVICEVVTHRSLVLLDNFLQDAEKKLAELESHIDRVVEVPADRSTERGLAGAALGGAAAAGGGLLWWSQRACMRAPEYAPICMTLANMMFGDPIPHAERPVL